MSSLFPRRRAKPRAPSATTSEIEPAPQTRVTTTATTTTTTTTNNDTTAPAVPPEAHVVTKTHSILPIHRVNHNGHKVTRYIHPDGESGRRGLHLWHFPRIVWRSSSDASRAVNILWPTVPAALAMRYARKEQSVAIFVLSYIAMIPCANLIGFAGQELARKMPKVIGVLTETTLGSVVEIVLFMVLLSHNQFPVVKAAILGSILATVLLCLGMCFFVGGLRREEQEFEEAVSEVGSGLLLTAGVGLAIPSIYYIALNGSTEFGPGFTSTQLQDNVTTISRITSIFLWIAYTIYIFFQTRTHHGIYHAILEADEEKDEDRHLDLKKDKLTFTECIIALAVSIALVTLIAIALVEEIEPIVQDHGVSDAFMGLILVPLVEKAAEHLTAVDEAWDNQANFALSHVLGATIQTALFNAPLVVIVGWGLDKPMNLNFELFNIVVLILAILVVGGFLRDQKSNYLEGALCVVVYAIVAVAAFYYPNKNSTDPVPVEG